MDYKVLCVACSVQQQKRLDIRDRKWQVTTCPGCGKPKQVVWPVIEKPINGQSNEGLKSIRDVIDR